MMRRSPPAIAPRGAWWGALRPPAPRISGRAGALPVGLHRASPRVRRGAAVRRGRGHARRGRRQRAGQGKAFVISSPSGGGKTTIISRLRRQLPGVVRSVSVTTRAPREGERRGVSYAFVSAAAFHQLKRAGQLLEWAKVHRAYYGTPKAPVLEALARREHVVLSIDVQGARQIRRALGRRAVLIFLLPPSMERLRERLMRRCTDTPQAVEARLAAARRELACARWYDYTVINDRLPSAVRAVAQIVRNEGAFHRGSAEGHRALQRRPSRSRITKKGVGS